MTGHFTLRRKRLNQCLSLSAELSRQRHENTARGRWSQRATIDATEKAAAAHVRMPSASTLQRTGRCSRGAGAYSRCCGSQWPEACSGTAGSQAPHCVGTGWTPCTKAGLCLRAAKNSSSARTNRSADCSMADCWSAMCDLLGFGGGAQLGPDQVPVVGAQVAAGDGAIGSALNGDTVSGTRAAICIAVLPLADLGVAGHSRALPQLADGQCARAR